MRRLRRKIVLQSRRDVPRPALKAEALEATAKPVSELAVEIDVERLVADRVAFHRFGHNRKRRRSAAKLALSLGERVGAAQVGKDLFKHILEATIGRRATIGVPFQNEKPIAVRQGGPMLPQPAFDRRYSFCGVFHAHGYSVAATRLQHGLPTH
jgi:hypothetical protein